MRVFITYFGLEIKRSYKVLARTIMIMLLTAAAICGCVVALGHFFSEEQAFRLVDVGVVIPDESNEAKLVMRYASTIESVESIGRLHYLGLTEAEKQLGEGKLQAVMILPEDIVESINNGENKHILMKFPKEQSLNTRVFKQIMLSSTDMLRVSEAGVYAMMSAGYEYNSECEGSYVGGDMARKYGELILKRENAYNQYVLSPFGKFGMEQYYISAFLVMFLCMIGVNFGYLYKKQTRVVEEKLRILSVGEGKLSIIKVVTMAMVLWTIGAILYIAISIASNISRTYYVSFDIVTLLLLFGIAVSIGLYFHIVYSMVNSGSQGTVVLLMLNMIMIIGSGVILPLDFLPEVIGRIGSFLPLYKWNEYMIDILYENKYHQALAMLAKLILAEVVIGVIISWKNILFGFGFSLKSD